MGNPGFRFGVGFALGVALVAGLIWMTLHDPKGLVEAGGWGIVIGGLPLLGALLVILMGRLSYKGHDLGIQSYCIAVGLVLLGGLFSYLFPNSPHPRELALTQKIGGWVFLALGAVILLIEFWPSKASEKKA